MMIFNISCIVGIVYTAIWARCSFLKVFLYEEREGKKKKKHQKKIEDTNHKLLLKCFPFLGC